MADIKFHEPTEEQLEICLGLVEDFYAIDQYPFDRGKVQNSLSLLSGNAELGRLWMLSVEGEIIGYLALTFGFSIEYGGRDAFIDELYLKPLYRGKGHGKSILAHLDELAAELGVHAIHLEVERSNKRGSRLYTGAGYEFNERSLLTKRLTK